MPHLPAIGGKDLIKILIAHGFVVTRSKGSHYRLAHKDGRRTTVAVHGKQPIPKGTLRKIIREDLKLTLEQFEQMLTS